MIYGIGTDLVSVERMQQALERHGERFAERVLAPRELDEFRAALNPSALLAKRFAAKEAFSRALGTGMRAPASWHNIAVAHDELGKPLLEFAPALAEFLATRNVLAHHLSISDEKLYVCAFVILER